MFSFYTNTVAPIQPQSSQGYELGTKLQILPSLRAGISLFKIDTRDEIFFNSNTFNNENLDGKTNREGAEFSLSWKALERLALFASYTYFSRARIEGGQFDGKRIPGVPEHKATAGALVSLTSALSLALNGIYVGSRPFNGDFQNSFSGQESYYVLNTKLQYRWRTCRAYLDVNNLTNERYSEYGVIASPPVVEKAFYPSPGRNFTIGMAADF